MPTLTHNDYTEVVGNVPEAPPKPNADLERRFSYHPPKPHRVPDFTDIRDMAYELAKLIDERCPEGREKALAITKAEEAVMWANAAIAREK